MLLFKDLTNSQVLIQDHLKAYPVNYLVDTYRKTHAIDRSDPNFNLDQKHHEAKDAVRGLLEILNNKYLSELRKDEDKKAEFMYSMFSDVHNQIKKEEPKLLREILELVQTAIIKLYIEGNRQDRIYDFFNTYAGQNGSAS